MRARVGAALCAAVIVLLAVPAAFASAPYTAPTPSGLEPFHRSLFSRFLLSPLSLVLTSLIVAALVALVLQLLLRRRGSTVVARVNEFTAGVQAAPPARQRRVSVRETLANSQRARGWWGRLERDLEIAEIEIPARRLVMATVVATVAVCFVLVTISPVVAILGLLTPLSTRSYVRRKLRRVRDEFADQLTTNLHVLASALRAGHSLVGALAVLVDNADEPSRREFRRALNDERLGAPIETAIRRVAVRMTNRDLEQVALLSELQRTSGGNAAEVLDTVVETIRERADLRRLVRTLTAQGRMARWILTALPVGVALFLWSLQPTLMSPLLHTTGGQFALVIASLMVLSGSLIIQRIVDIKV